MTTTGRPSLGWRSFNSFWTVTDLNSKHFRPTYWTNSLYGPESLKKLIVARLFKKFPTFYATQIFSTVLNNSCSPVKCQVQLSLSWTRWVKSIPAHTVPLRQVLIIFSHQCLDFPSGLFQVFLSELCRHLPSLLRLLYASPIKPSLTVYWPEYISYRPTHVYLCMWNIYFHF